ncbi:P-loop containing nucleoside triphosphate hydrolase protein [Blyttiomyces helicus]|uniref:ATP-dependent RNA helicase n=1 Tax=Blyttiomyces helicus TaxID=388810 RepID=A0A4P9VZ88_9FUNG|nr:P-loop containing nucleoside triphosphate hydrolase protein [Blyttiomyces helicus]|eukprot:RKO83668.1 P-loop containing nucleoside triphosphate hydrolase protein [Blyttiomyces helicus]
MARARVVAEAGTGRVSSLPNQKLTPVDEHPPSLEEIDGVDVEYVYGPGGGKTIKFKTVDQPGKKPAPRKPFDLSQMRFIDVDDFVEGQTAAKGIPGPGGAGVEDEGVGAGENDGVDAEEEVDAEVEEAPKKKQKAAKKKKKVAAEKPEAVKNAEVVDLHEGGFLVRALRHPHVRGSGTSLTAHRGIVTSDLDMSAWETLSLAPEIISGLRSQGFATPTEIQLRSLPVALAGDRDLIGAAQTGSGKTLAFGLPILQALAVRPPATEDQGCTALILVPTRELAMQVTEHLVAIAKFMRVRIVSIVGGMSLQKQRRQIASKPDVIVATPGRLWELMQEDETLLPRIRRTRFLAIDEADRMLESGHFKDLDHILNAISLFRKNTTDGDEKDSTEDASPDAAVQTRRTFIFSATLVQDGRLKQKLKSRVKKNKRIATFASAPARACEWHRCC